ncbi:MAG: hypothetical protein ACOY3P_06110 [Planctomycetota bacterium]
MGGSLAWRSTTGKRDMFGMGASHRRLRDGGFLSSRALVALLAACIWAGVGGGLSAADQPESERPAASELFPEDTFFFVHVPDVPAARERFLNTSLGRLSMDPRMRPLVDHFYGSLGEAVSQLQDRIALSLGELLELPRKEAAFGVVSVEGERPALVVIIGADEQMPNARRMLEKGTGSLESSGRKRTEEEIGGVTIVRLDNEQRDPPRTDVAYFEKDGAVVAATNADVLRRILAAWNGEDDEDYEVLAGNPNYTAAMNRCSAEGTTPPDVMLFFDPIALIRAQAENDLGARLAVAAFTTLGVDGIAGLGATLTLDTARYDWVLQMQLNLDEPRAGAVKVVAFDDGSSAGPPSFVPPEVSDYTSLYWNFTQSYEELRTVFDSFRGEGAFAGWISGVVGRYAEIDVENDVIPALGSRVIILRTVERPVTLASDVQAWAFELKTPEKIEEALTKLSQTSAPDLMVNKRAYGGREYFELERIGAPARENAPPLPRPSVGLIDGYLVVATQPALYERLVRTSIDKTKSLADELDYKLVMSRLQRHAGEDKPAVMSFSRPSERLRMLYEIAGSQQMRSGMGRNPFIRQLGQAVDKHPLPPFSVVEQYLAPTGALMINEDTGIYYLGFGLKRN